MTGGTDFHGMYSVSYTHLDVYKRQTLSGPMVWKERRLRILASVFLLPAIAATPAPGNVILDVEANIIGKSSFPCFRCV